MNSDALGTKPSRSEDAASRSAANDWVTTFLRLVTALFLGLPVGGLLFALAGVVRAFYEADPITRMPWSLAFRTLAAWIGFVFLGGFAWSPDDGYRSLHGWYAAGVILSFVLLMKPWQRRRSARTRSRKRASGIR